MKRAALPTLFLISLLSTSGCAYWSPHSLVAADRPFSGTVTGGGRARRSACRLYVLSIPAGGENPSIDNIMNGFYEDNPKAVGFVNLRFDEVLTNYFLWLFVERCVEASAEPVFAEAPAARQPAAAPEGAPTPPTPGGASPGASKQQLNQWLDPPAKPAQ